MNLGAKKVKFVINGPLPSDSAFPSFRDFEVVHHYLQTSSRMMQSRLRKRGRKGKWSYTHTIRKQVLYAKKAKTIKCFDQFNTLCECSLNRCLAK